MYGIASITRKRKVVKKKIYKFKITDRVKIVGLKGAPQYNNTYGTVGFYDDQEERYHVTTDLDGTDK